MVDRIRNQSFRGQSSSRNIIKNVLILILVIILFLYLEGVF